MSADGTRHDGESPASQSGKGEGGGVLPLTELQREVASAVGHEDNHERTEAIFGLERGTIEEWLVHDEFFELVNYTIDEVLTANRKTGSTVRTESG